MNPSGTVRYDAETHSQGGTKAEDTPEKVSGHIHEAESRNAPAIFDQDARNEGRSADLCGKLQLQNYLHRNLGGVDALSVIVRKKELASIR